MEPQLDNGEPQLDNVDPTASKAEVIPVGLNKDRTNSTKLEENLGMMRFCQITIAIDGSIICQFLVTSNSKSNLNYNNV